MKKIVILFSSVLAVIGCNNPSDKAAAKTDSTATPTVTYAYSLKKPDNWDIGSSANTAVALNALKAFENNKIDECLSYFADSVNWRTDYFDKKLSKDSLKSSLLSVWKDLSVKIDLWYNQTTTDKKGKVDSVSVINDLKISNGKIVALDEAFRHFPVKK